MSLFSATITIEGVGLGAGREALERAGIQLHGAWMGSGSAPGARNLGPQLVAEVEADTARDAEHRVSEALHGDYTVTAEPL